MARVVGKLPVLQGEGGDGMLFVTVYLADGRRLQIQLQRGSTLRDLGRYIEFATGLPEAEQRIIWQGKVLADGELDLSKYAIVNGSALALFVHLAATAAEEHTSSLFSSGQGTSGHGALEPPPIATPAHVQSPVHMGSVDARQRQQQIEPQARLGNHARPHVDRSALRRRPRGGVARGWWGKLTGDDVISMEPLAEMVYEPFELRANSMGESGGQDAYNFFDGKVLSRYLVSTGNFTHPVSRRPLTRAECVALDEYMTRLKLGEAAVTHAFDLKDDRTVSGTMYMAALQREAESILESLFMSSSFGAHAGGSMRTGRGGAQRHAGSGRTAQAPIQFPAVNHQAAQQTDSSSVPGWLLVDDDEQLTMAHTQQSFEAMWPQLPQLPSVRAPPKQQQQSIDVVEPPGAPAVPRPPLHHPAEERGDGVDWGLSAGAEALLRGSAGGSVRTILERQAGGAARDQAFAEEIAAIEGALSASHVLSAGGFEISRALLVSCAPFRDALRGAASRISKAACEQMGWQEMHTGEGHKFLYNTVSQETRWTPPEISGGEGVLGVSGGLAGGGMLCGLNVAFLWVPVPSQVLTGALRSGVHPSMLWKAGPSMHLVGAPMLEAALSLAADGVPCDKIEEGTTLSLIGAWVALGREGVEWGWGKGRTVWVAGDSDSACPCVGVEVRRLESVEEPLLWPGAGVHEDSVSVTMDTSTQGATIRFTLDGSDPLDQDLAPGVIQIYSRSRGLKLGQGVHTVRAVASKPGFLDSSIHSSCYIIKRRCTAPIILPKGGSVASSDSISLSTKTSELLPDVKIHYTLERRDGDGGVEGERVCGFYTKPIALPGEGTWRLRALAMHPSMLPSATSECEFKLAQPEMLPPAPAKEDPAKRSVAAAEASASSQQAEEEQHKAPAVVQPRTRIAGSEPRSIRSRRTRPARRESASDSSTLVQIDGQKIGQMVSWALFVCFVAFCVHEMLVAVDIFSSDPHHDIDIGARRGTSR